MTIQTIAIGILIIISTDEKQSYFYVFVTIQQRNPSAARHRCFQEVYPLIEKFLPYEKPTKDRDAEEATNDRLIHLLIKGSFIINGNSLS